MVRTSVHFAAVLSIVSCVLFAPGSAAAQAEDENRWVPLEYKPSSAARDAKPGRAARIETPSTDLTNDEEAKLRGEIQKLEREQEEKEEKEVREQVNAVAGKIKELFAPFAKLGQQSSGWAGGSAKSAYPERNLKHPPVVRHARPYYSRPFRQIFCPNAFRCSGGPFSAPKRTDEASLWDQIVEEAIQGINNERRQQREQMLNTSR